MPRARADDARALQVTRLTNRVSYVIPATEADLVKNLPSVEDLYVFRGSCESAINVDLVCTCAKTLPLVAPAFVCAEHDLVVTYADIIANRDDAEHGGNWTAIADAMYYFDLATGPDPEDGSAVATFNADRDREYEDLALRGGGHFMTTRMDVAVKRG